MGGYRRRKLEAAAADADRLGPLFVTYLFLLCLHARILSLLTFHRRTAPRRGRRRSCRRSGGLLTCPCGGCASCGHGRCSACAACCWLCCRRGCGRGRLLLRRGILCGGHLGLTLSFLRHCLKHGRLCIHNNLSSGGGGAACGSCNVIKNGSRCVGEQFPQVIEKTGSLCLCLCLSRGRRQARHVGAV